VLSSIDNKLRDYTYTGTCYSKLLVPEKDTDLVNAPIFLKRIASNIKYLVKFHPNEVKALVGDIDKVYSMKGYSQQRFFLSKFKEIMNSKTKVGLISAICREICLYCGQRYCLELFFASKIYLDYLEGKIDKETFYRTTGNLRMVPYIIKHLEVSLLPPQYLILALALTNRKNRNSITIQAAYLIYKLTNRDKEIEELKELTEKVLPFLSLDELVFERGRNWRESRITINPFWAYNILRNLLPPDTLSRIESYNEELAAIELEILLNRDKRYQIRKRSLRESRRYDNLIASLKAYYFVGEFLSLS